LQSRQTKRLTAYFPEITAAVREQIPAGTVLDGELIIYRDGRCDFTALHHRLTHPGGAAAASYVVFDVLAIAGQDLRGLPYRKRRNRLRHLLADIGPPLALMPATRDLVGAQAWMREHVAAGVEGWSSNTANTATGRGAGPGQGAPGPAVGMRGSPGRVGRIVPATSPKPRVAPPRPRARAVIATVGLTGVSTPGNFQLLDDGRLLVLDFGAVARLPDGQLGLEAVEGAPLLSGDTLGVPAQCSGETSRIRRSGGALTLRPRSGHSGPQTRHRYLDQPLG
jgi:hypothetical protein